MPKVKGKCVLNAELRSLYPFIVGVKDKSDSDVRCTKCSAVFSIANGGRSEISRHVQTNKHRLADNFAVSTLSLKTFFRGANLGSTEEKLAAAEGCFAFHTVQHNQTFRSMDCTSKLVQKCFDPKYSCAKTKCEAIVTNVISPFAMSELGKDLEKVNYITMYTDSSNHNSTKLFPLLIRYFDFKTGVQVKVLDFQEKFGENSDIVSSYILKALSDHNLERKIVGLCADNTNTNFGGISRKGNNNVYSIVQKTLERPIVGIGCSAHIINNTIQTAVDCLPICLESVIHKIYSYFHTYTVREASLQEFCNFVEIDYSRVLGYSRTRWLSMLPSIERVLKIFPALKSYFLSQNKCPTVMKQFFDSPVSEVWLHFANTQASLFHTAIQSLEGQHVTMVDACTILGDLRKKLSNRLDCVFIPLIVDTKLKMLESEGLVSVSDFKSHVEAFYSTCIQYLDQWTSHFSELEVLCWANLNSVFEWCDVKRSLDFVLKYTGKEIHDTNLFDEISNVRQYVTNTTVREWNASHKPTHLRWVEIFTKFDMLNIDYGNVSNIVEFILCLPATNAPTERVFSIMNNMWTHEKSRLKPETLKHLIITKCNFNQNCVELYDTLLRNPEMLKAIHSSEKYT